ncbi:MAG: GNVR domain-containing protein [Candidatus Omnitrophica bacterium]|nr:GNVR domain-containing protein [Candidatus Omnitrophota bacterium]
MENQISSKYQNPLEYLKILFRRKWLFIIPVLIGLVLSIIASFVIPPVYQSTTLILVEEEKIINPLIQGLAVSTTASQRMQTIREQLLGWNSLVDLTKRLNLAKDIASQLQFENLIFSLRKNIIVQMKQPFVIQISYFGKNPEQTKLVTKTLSDILVSENMRKQTKETDVAIDFIKGQLLVYKRKIKEGEIANLEDQLRKLMVDSTENHPIVKELKQKLEVVKKELESGNYEVQNIPIASNDPSYQILKDELDKLINRDADPSSALAYASDNNDPNKSIYKLMLMDKLESVAIQDKNVNEKIYNMLLQKLETAKITQRLEASKQGTRYTIIDPPRLPLKPAKPNKLIVVFLGLFLGTCTGAGFVFGKEFLDQSFLDIEDVKNSLELPVLGGISRITTTEEINKEKYRVKQWLIIGSIAATVLIISSVLYALFRK